MPCALFEAMAGSRVIVERHRSEQFKWKRNYTMKSLFCRFVEDRSGATAIEYGLIAALIGAALVSGMTVIGGAINNTMDHAANNMKSSQ